MSGAGIPIPRPVTAGEIIARLGLTSLTAGAILYAASATTLDKLPIGTAGRLLVAGASAPAWSSKLAEGTITGLMTLSKAGTTAREMTFPDAALVVAGSAAALTPGRVPYATTGGLLTDSSGLTYSVNTLRLGTDADSYSYHILNGAAAAQRGVYIRTASVERWRIESDTVPESGSDAGCGFRISARTDAGAGIDTPLSIVRAAGGAISLGRPLNAPFKIYVANTNNDSVRTTGGIELGQAGSISTNAYYSGGWKYRGANYATAIVDNGSSGLEFRSAVSGTADAALTWVAGLRVSPTAVTALLPVTVSNTTSATSGTTGALIVAGGIGSARPSYFATATSGYTLTLANSNGGSAPGLQILAGVSTDNALLIRNAADTVSLFRITGAGDATFAGGTVTIPNGAAATPGLRLAGEATGPYRIGATKLGFAVGGVGALGLEKPGSGYGGGFQLLTQADADYTYIYSDRTNAEMRIAPGANSLDGANIRLYGNGHATANQGSLRHSTTDKVTWNATGISFFGAAPVARPSLAAASGTATRTTFDTTTVTLPQLAERVKAMIDDLRGYGLAA
jgi:hypothetical protein